MEILPQTFRPTIEGVDTLVQTFQNTLRAKHGYIDDEHIARKLAFAFKTAASKSNPPGCVSFRDYFTACYGLGCLSGGYQARLEGLFDRYDYDGTGYVRYEFLAACIMGTIPDSEASPVLRMATSKFRSAAGRDSGPTALFELRAALGEIAARSTLTSASSSSIGGGLVPRRDAQRLLTACAPSASARELGVLLTEAARPHGGLGVHASELIMMLRGGISRKRRAILQEAWAALCQRCGGAKNVTPADVCSGLGSYAAKAQPYVLLPPPRGAGGGGAHTAVAPPALPSNVSAAAAAAARWRLAPSGASAPAALALDEGRFIDFYRYVGALIPGEEDFVAHIRQSFGDHIGAAFDVRRGAGGAGAAAPAAASLLQSQQHAHHHYTTTHELIETAREEEQEEEEEQQMEKEERLGHAAHSSSSTLLLGRTQAPSAAAVPGLARGAAAPLPPPPARAGLASAGTMMRQAAAAPPYAPTSLLGATSRGNAGMGLGMGVTGRGFGAVAASAAVPPPLPPLPGSPAAVFRGVVAGKVRAEEGGPEVRGNLVGAAMQNTLGRTIPAMVRESILGRPVWVPTAAEPPAPFGAMAPQAVPIGTALLRGIGSAVAREGNGAAAAAEYRKWAGAKGTPVWRHNTQTSIF